MPVMTEKLVGLLEAQTGSLQRQVDKLDRVAENLSRIEGLLSSLKDSMADRLDRVESDISQVQAGVRELNESALPIVERITRLEAVATELERRIGTMEKQVDEERHSSRPRGRAKPDTKKIVVSVAGGAGIMGILASLGHWLQGLLQ